MFAKLIDNTLYKEPPYLVIGENIVFNPSEETLKSYGYKPIIETEMPLKDGYMYTMHYEDRGNDIVQVWTGEKVVTYEEGTEWPLHEGA